MNLFSKKRFLFCLCFFSTAVSLSKAVANPNQTVISSNETTDAVPDEYVVKLKDNMIQNYSNDQELSWNLNSVVKTYYKKLNIAVIKQPMIETSDSVVQRLNKNPAVEIIEPNYIYHANKQPNDLLFELQWGLVNSGQTTTDKMKGTPGIDINIKKAWSITTGSKDIIVAVVDSGVDYKNPDLRLRRIKREKAFPTNGCSGLAGLFA